MKDHSKCSCPPSAHDGKPIGTPMSAMLVNAATQRGRKEAKKRLGLTFTHASRSRGVMDTARFRAYVLWRHCQGWRAKTISKHLGPRTLKEVHYVLASGGHAFDASSCITCNNPDRRRALEAKCQQLATRKREVQP